MKTFHCDRCGQQVFFEDLRCPNCGSTLGYLPDLQTISAFASVGDGRWRSLHPARQADGQQFVRCPSDAIEHVCNWMLDANSPPGLCASCELTRVVPALSTPDNQLYLSQLEAVKRWLLHSLWQLGLEPLSHQRDPANGLAFEFVHEGDPGGLPIGHVGGVIIINLAEPGPLWHAGPQQQSLQMHEPCRNLLAQFRHECGHYYFARLIAGEPVRLAHFRRLFGDERADYAQALRNHQDDPRTDWRARFVSRYASAHPWEDWAETWGHYLHMLDALDSAYCCGLELLPASDGEPILRMPTHPLHTDDWDKLLVAWSALRYAMNILSRSLGMPDPYPFVLSCGACEKLHFVHRVIRAHDKGRAHPDATTAAGTPVRSYKRRSHGGRGPRP